jgi:putative DNA primase/helicase
LTLPNKVRAATNEYRTAEDQVGQFINDRCVVGSAYRCRATDLYAGYKKWADAVGLRPESQTVFGEQMTKKEFERKTSNGTWYQGIALRNDLEVEPS